MRDTFLPLSVMEFRFKSAEAKRLSSNSNLLPYLTILTSEGGMAALTGVQPSANFNQAKRPVQNRKERGVK
jgi:hypothetical protein